MQEQLEAFARRVDAVCGHSPGSNAEAVASLLVTEGDLGARIERSFEDLGAATRELVVAHGRWTCWSRLRESSRGSRPPRWRCRSRG